ncbi:MAG: zinc-dependent metalloprotease [Actinobacteria bacterium]|nr:zinc-dependent metalloprotease [Actinomycetota bacterium]
MTFLRSRLAAVAATALLAPALLVAGSSPAGSLPDRAAPAGHEHAHTHGPDGLALDRGGPNRVAAAAPYDVDAHAPWSKAEWDGLAPTADVKPDVAVGPQIHAVYVYPARSTSRFLDFAAMFQADARQANTLLSATRNRALRFDERVGADGSTRYLDITVFRSKYNAKQLAGSNQFSLVANELEASGKFSEPDKKYVVWLDAGSKYCGQATLYHDTTRSELNANNGRTTGIVYRPYSTTNGEGGFWPGRTLLHELGHNLGALQADAPSSFDDAHCNDSAEDVMCYTSQTSNDTGGPVFDHGDNDYWDPSPTAPLPWWTVNLSKFVCTPGAGGTC